MKDFLFDSWHQWKVCFLSGCKNFLWGLARIITCIILGIFSLIREAWRILVRYVGKYPAVAIIIAVVFFCLFWLFTCAHYQAKVVGVEHERDSIAYRMSRYEPGCVDSDFVIIDGDTIELPR